MADEHLVVKEVLDAMNALVARDGASVELTSYEPGVPIVQVHYNSGQNDECDSCMITPDMLKDFLLEGFRSHDLDVVEVQVATS